MIARCRTRHESTSSAVSPCRHPLFALLSSLLYARPECQIVISSPSFSSLAVPFHARSFRHQLRDGFAGGFHREERWATSMCFRTFRILCCSSLILYAMQPSGPSSLAAIAAAFIPTAVIAILYLMAFTLLRRHYPKIYFPRTYIGTVPEKDRTPSQSRSYWDWIHTMRVVPDKFTLHHQSLDSYLFLRFLRTLIFICVVGAVITWPILLPVNATGGGTSKELNRISIGNVKKKSHLYAHATIAWVFFSFVMFTIARERLWLIGLRQAWKSSKSNANRLSSRTVLFLSSPTAALDENNLQRFFGNDAVRIWPSTNADKLQSLVSARDTKVEELESAEISLIHNVNKEVKKSQEDNNNRNLKYENLPKQMKRSLRPTHRLKTQPRKQVDSIDWLRDRIKEKEGEIEQARDSNSSAESLGGAAAVFVEFRTQMAAQRACQQIASSDILSLTPRYTGVMPSEVIWENLNLAPTRRISQAGISVILVVAIIVFWSIPVSLVGLISNIQYLADNIKWLGFLNNLPSSVMNLLSGLIPSLLLSALAAYVPNIFRCEPFPEDELSMSFADQCRHLHNIRRAYQNFR